MGRCRALQESEHDALLVHNTQKVLGCTSSGEDIHVLIAGIVVHGAHGHLVEFL